MNKANPPPHLRLPPGVKKNAELARVLDEMNFNMFLLWKKLGGGADFISENETNINQSATLSRLFDIREQIGSGHQVTIDTTGFTIDTTEQTTDMTEV